MIPKESDKRVEMYDNGPYPITILLDLHSGLYSGAMWLAFNCKSDEVPEAVEGFDSDCMQFWDYDADESVIGFGSTPDEAYEDLCKKIKINENTETENGSD